MSNEPSDVVYHRAKNGGKSRRSCMARPVSTLSIAGASAGSVRLFTQLYPCRLSSVYANHNFSLTIEDDCCAFFKMDQLQRVLIMSGLLLLSADWRCSAQRGVRRRQDNNSNSMHSRFDSIILKNRAIVEENFGKSDSRDNAGGRSLDPSNELGTQDGRLPSLVVLEKTPKGPLRFEKDQNFLLQKAAHYYLRLVGNTSSDPRTVAMARRQGKFEKIVPASVPFPCDVSRARSAVRPDRADRVRPGDIDIVAALGDSLSAGASIVSTLPLHVYIANRGLSGFIGGQGTWREHMTLPNILKVFNPNVTGFSTGDTVFSEQHRFQKLNMAELGAEMIDLTDMAKALHDKIAQDPTMDMQRDWKLVTIFMGHVDFCLDVCYWKRPYDAPKLAERSFREALDYLFDNFPRTIVTLFVAIDIPKLMRNFKYGEQCAMQQLGTCPCITGSPFANVQPQYERIVDQILDVQAKVGEDEKYKSRADFRVMTSQLFRKELRMPDIRQRGRVQTDLRYLAYDCFHLSQRGHALGARNIWNALMAPSGHKPLWNRNHVDLICPTEENPYINV